jgi:hypothetical protein
MENYLRKLLLEMEKYLLRSLGTLLDDGQYIAFSEKLPIVTGKIFFPFILFNIVQNNARLRIKTKDGL